MPERTAEDEQALAALRALVRIPTVSRRDGADAAAFDLLHAELADRFPRMHAELELVPVPPYGLLYRWAGSSRADPVVLMAHQDVVPVDPEAPWRHEPFSAELHDGAVWGRGTLDDKGSLAAVCSAVERALVAGVVPARDVWLFFGCDEEVSGDNATRAVEELRGRGVRPWFVLDEGGAVAHDAFPGVAVPVAVIGVTEKGVTSLELVASGRGGHASTPAPDGPVARVARALTRLERSPMRASLPVPTRELLTRLAPHVSGARSTLMSRADRLSPLLTRVLAAAGPEAAAMARTTLAATTLSGSPALNVIASRAVAGLNARVLPGDSVDEVVDHVRRTVRDGSVEVRVVERGEPSPVSPYVDDDAFDLLESLVAQQFPDATCSPYVMMAATDARHFTAICERVYRFTPFRMSKAQREAIHSYDEHLGVEDYLAGVRWYARLLERLPR